MDNVGTGPVCSTPLIGNITVARHPTDRSNYSSPSSGRKLDLLLHYSHGAFPSADAMVSFESAAHPSGRGSVYGR